jgi:signal transduction histidine kinase/ActR/RegA family two-component response regulator
MRFFRRSLAALGVAAMLPTVVFSAFSVFYLLRVERERVETATLARSQTLMMLVDSQLQRHLAALDVLTSAVYFDTQDWKSFYGRSQRVLNVNPLWETIVLIDVASDQQLLDLRTPFGLAGPIDTVHRQGLQAMAASARQTVGPIESNERPIVWIYAPVLKDGGVKYALAAGLKPQAFQDLLVSLAQRGSTAAIVDQNGTFVGRTLSFDERVGTPATHYVREAIRAKPGGLYQGTTYEGLKNYTAYHVSPFSGWSAHLAVASATIDSPGRWSFVAAGLAALGGLLLGGFLVILVLRDMAERRRADEMLRQSQKMEAIGQLTGGIAHDFNNLLTAIIGNLDMIRNRAANDRLQRLADNALEAARRGAKLSSQLLAFSRSQRMNVSTVDLQQLLNGMSGLLSQSVGPAVHVDVRIANEARFVVSDANQLELALLNLAVNARDAMPNGGALEITARRTTNTGGRLPAGDYVDLCVADTGVGMSEEVRSRAIEPFFTTKPVGQGTGLGLSQVYGVVRESRGALNVESEPGRGTTVCLTLLAASPVDATVGEHPVTVAAPQSQPGPPVRILVVDDDRLVRRFMSDSLRSLRYHVVDAEHGAEALEILNKETFDLMVVDFAMPGMNGADVARAAQAKQPALRVLVVSGYADSAALEAALGSVRQLRKPFNLAELGAAVAETMAAARQEA